MDLIGEAYHERRHRLMSDRNEGLTDIYNRFHMRGEGTADVEQLRELHVEMDQAVSNSYGWSDVDLGHGFHKTKQGVRFTISEPARHICLNRLLALNHQRHMEEEAEKAAQAASAPVKRRGKKTNVADKLTLDLL